MHQIKKHIAFILLFLFAANSFANPCADFIDVAAEPHQVYFSPESGFCIIDKILEDKVKFEDKKTVQSEQYGSIDFLRSANGNVAMLGDVLAMAGVEIEHSEIRPQFLSIITAIVTCFAQPATRDQLVSVGRWAAISIAGNALWEGVKWLWNKLFD